MAILFGAAVILALAASLMLLVIWILMIADVIVTRSDIWALAGHDRLLCFCIVFALGPIGAIIYGLAVRPTLARVEMSEAVHKAEAGPLSRSGRTAAPGRYPARAGG